MRDSWKGKLYMLSAAESLDYILEKALIRDVKNL
jgi:hypothetical protein